MAKEEEERESKLVGMKEERISSESRSESESESESEESESEGEELDIEDDDEDEDEDGDEDEDEESVISVSWFPDCPFGFMSNTPRPRFF